MNGEVQQRIDCGVIQDQPQIYNNALQGDRQELAVVAGGKLHYGPLGEPLRPWQGQTQLVAGPIVVSTGIETLLVVADIRGVFTAVDISDGSVSWQRNFDVADVSPFARVDGEVAHAVCALDGSRLMRFRADGEGIHVIWESAVDLRLGAYPQIAGDQVVVMGSSSATVCALSNGERRSLDTDGQELDALAVGAGMVGLGTAGNSGALLTIRRDGAAIWQRPMPEQIGAVAVTADQIWVGMTDGQLWRLDP